METFADPKISEISSKEGNNKCFDCGNENPKWASINNGIFLCLKCAGIHRSFGLQFSIIRSLQIDSWSQKQLLFLSKGGNNKFQTFLSEYKILPNSSNELKYKSKASQYYRQILNIEVEKSLDQNFKIPEIEKPNIETGIQILEIKENNKEINNDFIMGSNVINTNSPPQQEDNSFLGYVNTFVKDFAEIAKDAVTTIGNSISELKITDTVLNTGNIMLGYAKQGGEYIVNKTKEVANSDIMQNFSKSAGEEINNIMERSKNLLDLEQERNPYKQNSNVENLENNNISQDNQQNINAVNNSGSKDEKNINMNAEEEKKTDQNIGEEEKKEEKK